MKPKLPTAKTYLSFICLTSFLAAAQTSRAADEIISLKESPAKVQDAVKATSGSNKVVRVEKAQEDGHVQYEVLTEKTGGKKIEFIFMSDGTLDSTEERVDKAELNEATQKSIARVVGAGGVHGIERVTKDKVVTIEVSYKAANGGHREAVFSPAGDVVSDQVDKD